MPQSVSEIIYQAFFDRLAEKSAVKADTIQALIALYESQQLSNKQSLARLAREMETRHAQDQNSDCS